MPEIADFAQFSGLPSGLGVIGVALLIVVVNGFGEETGWRGYALPQLQKRFSPLTSTLILAGFWAGWHIPQFFALHSYKGFSAATGVGFLFGLDVWCGRCDLAVQPHGWKHPGGRRVARHLQRRRAGRRQLPVARARSPQWSATMIIVQALMLVGLEIRDGRRGTRSILGPP